MTARTTKRGGAWIAAAVAVALLFAGTAAGCNGEVGPSSGGGSHSLTDTAYWEGVFAGGWSPKVESVVAKGAAAMPLLNNLLASKDETVVSTAAMALNDMGPAGKAALPGLLNALKTFPEQSSVIDVVKKDTFAADAVPHMIAWLRGSDPKLQIVAAKLMTQPKLRAAGDGAIPVLLEVIQGGASDEVKIEAMGAVASFGIPADDRARPILQQVADAGGPLKTYAQRAIKRLDSAHAWKKARDWKEEQERKAAE